MKRIVLSLAVCGLMVLGGVAFGATTHNITLSVTSFAVWNLNPGNAITLNLNTTATAGSSTISASDNNNWLQYTNIAPTSAGTSGVVTVQLGAGTLIPAWLDLTVTAATTVGGGGTNKGTTTGAKSLVAGGAAQTVLDTIGSCYTGSTISADGSQITFALSIVAANIASAYTLALGTYLVTYTVTP